MRSEITSNGRLPTLGENKRNFFFKKKFPFFEEKKLWGLENRKQVEKQITTKLLLLIIDSRLENIQRQNFG
jgi:hypothetical protein